jgi:hypothetical protein
MRRCRKFPDFEIFQYVFSQKIFCALPTALFRPLMTITHAMSGLGTGLKNQPIAGGPKCQSLIPLQPADLPLFSCQRAAPMKPTLSAATVDSIGTLWVR